jgi:hypothetical protein
VLALGAAGHLYPLLQQVFPAMGVARYPVKYLFIAGFSVPLLAAFGASGLAKMPARRRNAFLISILAAFTAIMAVLFWFQLEYPLYVFPAKIIQEFRSNSLARWAVLIIFGALLYSALAAKSQVPLLLAMLLLLGVDARFHLKKQNPLASPSIFVPGFWTEARANLPEPELGNGRVFITPPAETNLLRSTATEANQEIIGLRLGLWSHLNLLDLAPKVNGSSTLQMGKQALIQNSLYSGTNANLGRWLDFLNVKLQTSRESAIEWEVRTNWMPFITAGQKLVHETRADDAVLDTLNNAFNFGTTVLVHDMMSASLNATAVELSDVAIGHHQIAFTARSEIPSLAVIAQSWHPAWKVSYSGPSAPGVIEPRVLRANLAFQAVPLPAGEVQVRLYYRDDPFRKGVILSLIALGICGACLVIRPVKQKRLSHA